MTGDSDIIAIFFSDIAQSPIIQIAGSDQFYPRHGYCGSGICVAHATSADQFFPWIATGPDGLLSLIWVDRRLDPNNVDYDAFYTNTFDGVTFSPNIRVSSVTSVLGNLDYIGDYIGLAATGTSVFPVWTDRRDKNNLDIFTARGTIAP